MLFELKLTFSARQPQKPEIEVYTALKHLRKLVIHFESMRDSFDSFEEHGKKPVIVGILEF